MHQITFYLDFVSPYAYIAFERLPRVLQGLSYNVQYQPVLLGAVLQHHGQRGPAEIPAKREWLYRHVQWLAAEQHIPLQMPAAHPFTPLPLLRLAVASDTQGLPNRHTCASLFRHVWQDGADALDATRLDTLRQQLPASREPGDAEVKQQLRSHTEQAIAAGVFGVPSFVVNGKLFWGVDALPMLRAYLDGSAWFDGPQWDAVQQLPSGLPGKATA
ncbi:2-hydroxychromene-2-carboxylate isomerase [Variovorax sp. HJSM1_2]|uniref:2-hydroxychromene-2-carboxylate isomerase n=1 Tax=Variovorax sp. HJSM1_2 TaxID=3366263 RepID=UPI003BC18F8D